MRRRGQPSRNILLRLVQRCTPIRMLFFTIIFALVFEVYLHIALTRKYYLDDRGQWRMQTKIEIHNPLTNEVNVFTIDWSSEVSKSYDSEEFYKDFTMYENANDTHPCSLTIVVMDPRLPVLDRDGALWGTLESVIHYGPEEMCLNIQTSSCISEQLEAATSIQEKAKVAHAEIHERAPLPLLRQFLKESGRVRITFMNETKYHLRNCSNFISPTHAWMNYHYWEDEFIPDVDNDLVMFVQDDSVLCNHLFIDQWKDVAYVGAPWPNKHKAMRKPSQCDYMSTLWATWTSNNTKTDLCRLDKDSDSDEQFYNGPFGNGGLSLRRRTWMQKAIIACPHVKYSGLAEEEGEVLDADQYACTVKKAVPEDLYFSIVLRAIHAPLPTPFEASLFSSEIIFPEQVALEWYGPKNLSTLLPLVKSRFGTDSVDRFLQFWNGYMLNYDTSSSNIDAFKASHHFTPIGLHNIWFYHDAQFLMSLADPIKSQCKYFKYILPMQSLPPDLRMKAYKFGIKFHGN